MKLAAIVILYHPPANVLKNILSYYSTVEKLFVFDNTEASTCKEKFDELDKVTFIHDGKNEGIAKRLNDGCTMAQAEGYEWVLTMDQDSWFSATAIENYIYCIETFLPSKSIAIFGLMPTDKLEEVSTKDCRPIETPLVITSGSVTNTSIANSIGGFDEKLFIDGVDHEFCLRANLNGYKTIKLENIYLLHAVGEQVFRASFKSLYTIKKRKWIHGPIRCYYIFRNALYLEKKYSNEFPEFVKKNTFLVKLHLDRSLWYGRDFFRTWWYIQKAKRDFKKGIMGKLITKK